MGWKRAYSRLAAVLVLGLMGVLVVGCGSKTEAATPTTGTKPAESQLYRDREQAKEFAGRYLPALVKKANETERAATLAHLEKNAAIISTEDAEKARAHAETDRYTLPDPNGIVAGEDIVLYFSGDPKSPQKVYTFVGREEVADAPKEKWVSAWEDPRIEKRVFDPAAGFAQMDFNTDERTDSVKKLDSFWSEMLATDKERARFDTEVVEVIRQVQADGDYSPFAQAGKSYADAGKGSDRFENLKLMIFTGYLLTEDLNDDVVALIREIEADFDKAVGFDPNQQPLSPTAITRPENLE